MSLCLGLTEGCRVLNMSQVSCLHLLGLQHPQKLPTRPGLKKPGHTGPSARTRRDCDPTSVVCLLLGYTPELAAVTTLALLVSG